MPEPPQRRGLKLAGPLEALGQLAAWLLGSSLSPERIDWWRPPARQEDDTGLLISLASINAHTLDEQIGCIAAKAAPLAITAQTLEPAELASLVGQSQGSETGSSDWLLRLAVRPNQATALLADPALAGLPVVLGAGSGLGICLSPTDLQGGGAQAPLPAGWRLPDGATPAGQQQTAGLARCPIAVPDRSDQAAV
jgi:glycolate oxidase FAD binding subunit